MVALTTAFLLMALPAAATAQEPAHRATHEVVLSDGQTLVGRVVRQTDAGVTLALADGRTLEIPAEAIRSVAPIEAPSTGAWGRDPNRTRYLYSPTAFSLGTGRGYVAQRAIVITSAAVGVTSFLDLEGGTFLPLLFTETPVGVVGAKLAAPVADPVRLGLGAQTFFLEDMAAGVFFANSTVGSSDRHVTLAGGAAMTFTDAELGAVVATASGNWRLSPSLALITETWFLYFTQSDGPWGGPVFVVPSGGVRLFGTEFAVDLALVLLVTGENEAPVVPLPWVSFAWNW